MRRATWLSLSISSCRVKGYADSRFSRSRIAREEADLLEARFSSTKAAQQRQRQQRQVQTQQYVDEDAGDAEWERVERPASSGAGRRRSVGDAFRQNQYVALSHLSLRISLPGYGLDADGSRSSLLTAEPDASFDLPSRRPRSNPTPPALAPAPPLLPPAPPPKPLLPPSKASRIAAWSASVPASASSSSESSAPSASSTSTSSSSDPPLRSALKGSRAARTAPVSVGDDDGLDGVVEPFDAFQPVTGKQSAGQLYGTWVRRGRLSRPVLTTPERRLADA